MTVLLDMANSNGHLHGGCTAMLIDKHVSSTRVQLQLPNDWTHSCSSIPIYVLGLATSAIYTSGGGVSQSLNIVYHSPASMYVRRVRELTLY
jgi:acyl-coenzyme A thioesterase 13